MANLIVRFSSSLSGSIAAPSDKSISHRAVILSSLAKGTSYIENVLNSDDVKITINCFKQLGVSFSMHNSNCEVVSKGKDHLFHTSCNSTPQNFYLGNSGTSARLLMGVFAAKKSMSLLAGDVSLNKRPMGRVLKPLSEMGVVYRAVNNSYLPISLSGGNLHGINYELEVPSAQVKSAILLAGLFTKDEIVVKENVLTRDHTELMLKEAGINLKIAATPLGKTTILAAGKKEVNAKHWKIPGDFSSSAFLIVAGLLAQDSYINITGVNLNPLRTGLLTVLQSMGADVPVTYKTKIHGEDYGNILVQKTKNSTLKPVIVSKDIVPKMIDEFPILSVLASFIDGESIFLGVKELRYKESDRIKTIQDNFKMLGIKTSSTEDSLHIFGSSGLKPGGITINPYLDHRIAMAFIVMGLNCRKPITIENSEIINTSFPDFVKILQKLGANISEVGKEINRVNFELQDNYSY